MPSVGILGGTFNPPHVGHLALARHACEELGLERVLLMPCHTPPHKPIADSDVGPEHRLAMCRLAVEGSPKVAVSGLEIERGGTSYTVDTLRAIHAADPDARLTLLVGADMALTLASWREPHALLELSDLAIARRSGTDPQRVLEALAPLAPEDGRVRFLEMPAVDVSSSMVRALCAEGGSTEGLLSAEVAAYIAEHGLYREQGEGFAQ